jgi:death on curing protein
MREIIYLTEQDVELINHTVIEMFSPGEILGVKDRSLLQSALARPQQSVLGEDAYKTIFQKAAALFESLAQNHAMHNANKRTAFTALDHFLYYNGYEFRMDPNDAVEFTVDVVLKKIPFEQLAEKIKSHSRKL